MGSRTPAETVWVGWSLGGMIAQQLAIDAPERVTKLVLVGSSPCFVSRPEWPHAMALSTLQQFAENLQMNYRSTLKRFLALEVHGSDRAKEQLRVLSRILFQHGEPDLKALQDGLAVLEKEDLRSALPSIVCPTLLLLGEQDKLVPASVGTDIQSLLPQARFHVFEKAGHTPFLSHLTEFTRLLRDFINE